MKPTDYKSLLIMIVEDDEIEVFLLMETLALLGITKNIIVFRNGKDAYDYFEKMKDGESLNALPDMIFLDLNMPKLNGHEFLKAFSELPESINLYSKIIIHSSSDDPEDKMLACKYSQVMEYCVKPISREVLYKCFNISQRKAS